MACKGKRFPQGDLPRGFAFGKDSFADLVGDGRGDCLRLARGIPAVTDTSKYDKVILEGIPSSANSLRHTLAQIYPLLNPGGDLFFRVTNQRAWHRIQALINGYSVTFAPAGANVDPLLAVDRSTLARDLFFSGLVTREIVDVPGMGSGVGKEFLESIWRFDLDGSVIEREGRIEWYYVHARREEPLSGSVIIAAQDPAAASETREYLEGILPPRWEIVVSCPQGERAENEVMLWNRGVTRSRGDRLWFLRAGQRPAPELLPSLIPEMFNRNHVVVSADPADLAGMLIQRRDIFDLGFLPDNWQSATVAREEYSLWMSQRGRNQIVLEAPIPGPAPGNDNVQEEAAQFLEKWDYLNKRSAQVEKQEEEAVCPWVDREPTISLCMIVKDEEKFLPTCLAAAAEAVDEIIIVDTGSTDRTIEIAKEYGAKVIEETWTGDFSEARNHSLRAASGDWIMVLDADEELQAESVGPLRRAVQDATVLAYHLSFKNIKDEGTETIGVKMVRLFRNLEGIKYEKRIHEQVINSLIRASEGMNLGVGAATVKVIHHGYTTEVMDDREKKARNWDLFEQQVEEEPEDFYTWYKFGDFMRRYGTPALVKEKLEKALSLILKLPESELRQVPYAAEIATLTALEYSKEGDQERAEELLVLAMDRFMRTPNTYFIAGGVAVRSERPGLSLEYYDHCLDFKDRVLVVPIEEGLADFATWHAIGAAWIKLGFCERGREYIEAAIMKNPDYFPAILGLSAYFLQVDDPQQALGILTFFLEKNPDAATAWEQGGGILLRLGMLPEARDWAQRAAVCPETTYTTWKLLGEVHLLSGDPVAAGIEWEKMDHALLKPAGKWAVAVLFDSPQTGPAPEGEAWGWIGSLSNMLNILGNRNAGNKLRQAAAAAGSPLGGNRNDRNESKPEVLSARR